MALSGRLEAERAEMPGELIVSGKISGLGVRMVLDTGASVSLISTYLWKNLRAVDPRWTLMPTNAQIRTVSGDLANVRGQAVLEVAIGEQYYVQQFLVMDVQEDIISGLDFVQRYKVDWNWRRGILTLRGREAVAFRKYRTGDAKARRIVTGTRVQIPAFCMAVVETKIKSGNAGCLPQWGVVLPARNPTDFPGVVAAATLVDPQIDSIPVMVMNPTESTIILAPGQPIGIMLPVEHVSRAVTTFPDAPEKLDPAVGSSGSDSGADYPMTEHVTGACPLPPEPPDAVGAEEGDISFPDSFQFAERDNFPDAELAAKRLPAHLQDLYLNSAKDLQQEVPRQKFRCFCKVI